jgi:hypothetical protein
MMVLLAAYAGLRVHEIAKFRGRDLDRARRRSPSSGRAGRRPSSPRTTRSSPRRPRTPRRTGGSPQPTAGRSRGRRSPRRSRRALRAAGVHATAHQLRHWYATALLEAGVDVRVVMELMRHSSLQSTQIYTRVSAVQRTAAIDRLASPAGQTRQARARRAQFRCLLISRRDRPSRVASPGPGRKRRTRSHCRRTGAPLALNRIVSDDGACCRSRTDRGRPPAWCGKGHPPTMFMSLPASRA